MSIRWEDDTKKKERQYIDKWQKFRQTEVHLSHQTHLIGTTDPTLPRKNDDNHDGDHDRNGVNIYDRLKISSPHSVGILKKDVLDLSKCRQVRFSTIWVLLKSDFEQEERKWWYFNDVNDCILTEEYISWLAQVITIPDTPDSHTKMTVKIVTIMMMMMVTMMTMMMTLSSGEGEHSGEVNRPLSATCQPTYNHSRSRKSCDDVGRGDNYCDDDDKDEADDNVDVRILFVQEKLWWWWWWRRW